MRGAVPAVETSPYTDAVCLGESLVTFVPHRAGPLADVPSFDRAIGGAESNVACALARAGHRVRWVSRVGADGFGDHLVRTIAGHGVDTSAVARDGARPTGIYFRTSGERATTAPGCPPGGPLPGGPPPGDGTDGAVAPDGPVAEVVYYRAGSAASAMSPENTPAPTDCRVLHLTGITAALSASCLALLRQLTAPRPGRPCVSFDVNYRLGLWRTAPEGPEVLLELARGCDLVFVGEDEAAAAWGVTGGPAAVRAALPEPRVLIVKRGAAGATAFTREPADGEPQPGATAPEPGAAPGASGGHRPDTVVSVAAPRVDVVASVGAGDAFAAGYLSASLRDLPTRDRLRHGHLTAAAALTVPGDLAAPPAREHADRLAALSDEAWETLRLGPGWTAPGDEHPTDAEVPTA
ncbi:sugar kinase [Streptomyces sp. AJS327]|uniref:sugar kinase n=1 Tax=Streptomyces sp. AJS327 TaxID=2545265 RepID=UPI0015DF60C2|nr:sugar kinase [Streptomyces sp. AJS327]MBA0051298.1 sugar kinase [Streptomyces sp. AJS327]